MSILFKKLNHLKGQSDQNRPSTHRLETGQEIYTFKRIIFSPKGALFILIAIIGFGCISFYSLAFLKSMLDRSSQNAFVVQHQNNQSLDVDESMDDDVSEDEEGMAEDGNNGSETKNEPFSVPEYFVVQASVQQQENGFDENRSDDGADNVPTTQVQVKLNKNEPMTGSSEKSIYTLLKKTIEPEPNDPKMTLIRPAPPLKNVMASSISAPRQPQKPADPKPAPSAQLKPDPEKREIIEQMEALRKNKDKRSKQVAAIADLASRLEMAVDADDRDRVDQLISKIDASTDKNTAYSMKLKAFHLIKKNKYDQAKVWLNAVLKRNPTDLEAGLNMAVIDIRQNKLADAKKRLLLLQEWYPANTTINGMLDRL
jgi:hypothetical protein